MAVSRVKRTINKSVTKNFSVTITADEIRRRFRLPEDAEVVFRVPTGGDWSGNWSGTDVQIEDGLSARWSRQS